MFKIIMLVAFLVTSATALTFACACVVGSRYEKRTEEAQPTPENTTYSDSDYQ